MTTAGLRELRQNASALVHRAEKGERITVTVSGRPVAELGPVTRPRTWRRRAEVMAIFDQESDPAWAVDRDAFDQVVRDPFESPTR